MSTGKYNMSVLIQCLLYILTVWVCWCSVYCTYLQYECVDKGQRHSTAYTSTLVAFLLQVAALGPTIATAATATEAQADDGHEDDEGCSDSGTHHKADVQLGGLKHTANSAHPQTSTPRHFLHAQWCHHTLDLKAESVNFIDIFSLNSRYVFTEKMFNVQ